MCGSDTVPPCVQADPAITRDCQIFSRFSHPHNRILQTVAGLPRECCKIDIFGLGANHKRFQYIGISQKSWHRIWIQMCKKSAVFVTYDFGSDEMPPRNSINPRSWRDSQRVLRGNLSSARSCVCAVWSPAMARMSGWI